MYMFRQLFDRSRGHCVAPRRYQPLPAAPHTPSIAAVCAAAPIMRCHAPPSSSHRRDALRGGAPEAATAEAAKAVAATVEVATVATEIAEAAMAMVEMAEEAMVEAATGRGTSKEL